MFRLLFLFIKFNFFVFFRWKFLLSAGWFGWGMMLSLAAQTSQSGLPALRFFSPQQYGGTAVTNDLIQDSRGILYVAHEKGIREFDGHKWDKVLYLTTNVLSLAKDEAGRIYAGGIGGFGMLYPDSLGKYQYLDFAERTVDKKYVSSFPAHAREFKNVWSVQCADLNVFFQTDNFLFIYDPLRKTVKAVTAPKGGSFFYTYNVRKEVYAHVKGVGLHVWRNDSLQPVHNGFQVAEEDIMSVLPYGTHELLIATRKNGLLLFNGKDFVPFLTPANEYLISNELYKAVPLGENHYVFGTKRGGILILHKNGAPVRIIAGENSVSVRTIDCLYTDATGGIWFGNTQGIVRVSNPLLVGFHSSETGLKGLPCSIISHSGIVYVATDEGLFATRTEDRLFPEKEKFNKLAGGKFVKIVSFGGKLITASASGQVSEILPGGNLKNIFTASSVNDLCPSVTLKNKRLFIGTAEGVHFLDFNGIGWSESHSEKDLGAPANEISEEADGTIWVRCDGKGFYAFRKGTDKAYEKTLYNFYEKDLGGYDLYSQNKAGKNKLISAGGKTYFNIFPRGLLAFRKNGKFVSDSTFGAFWSYGARNIVASATDSEGNLRFLAQELDGKGRLELYRINGKKSVKADFSRFLPAGTEPSTFHLTSQNVLWVGHTSGVLRLDLNAEPGKVPFFVNVRNFKLRWNSPKDSTFRRSNFFGVYDTESGEIHFSQLAADIKVNPYRKSNRIRLEWAAAHFEEGIEYQYYLEGLEVGWSPPTKQTSQEYTNLDAYIFPKTYTLKVRATDPAGNFSAESAYSFTIEPPYYLNIWSVILYGVSGVVVFLLSIKAYNQRLVRQNRNLNIRIEEATHEIRIKNDTLELTNQNLNSKTLELEASQKELSLQNEKLEKQKQELEKNQLQLSLQNEQLEQNNRQLSEQNEKILRQTDEILKQKDELDRSYHTIQNQLNTIITQQDQLVQTQKMAALGEITPIVAHEINTPLGAIKAGLEVISEMLITLLKETPDVLSGLDGEGKNLFWEFLEVIKKPALNLTTKEERSLIRKYETAFEDENLSEDLATGLVKIGYVGDPKDHLPFFRLMNAEPKLADEIFKIGTVWKQLSAMGSASEKARQKIKALQYYVGSSNAGAERTLQSVSVAETVGAVLTLYDFYISQGTEVSVEIDPSVKIRVYPQDVIQVWTNFIMSAVYAMNKKGNLEIRAGYTGEDNVVMTFIDTAPPLAPEEIEHLFDAGANSRKTEPAVSLAICKIRAEEYGGKVRAEVNAESRNVLTIELPRFDKVADGI